MNNNNNNNKEESIILRMKEVNNLILTVEVDVNQISFYRPETRSYFGGLEIEVLENVLKVVQAARKGNN